MIKIIKLAILAVFALFFVMACTDNTPIDPNQTTGEIEREPIPRYPRINFLDSLDALIVDSALPPGDTFKLMLMGDVGDSLLTRLTISANNEPLPAERLSINGQPVSGGAFSITGAEQNGFIWEIDIVAQQEKNKVIYEFRLEDETTRFNIVDILINTKITPFTPPVIDVGSEEVVRKLTGESVEFNFTLEALGSPIESIHIYQGAGDVPQNRIKFGGFEVPSNPFRLEGEDRRNFDKTIEIIGDTIPGLQVYTVEFIDSLDNSYYREVALDAIRRVKCLNEVVLSFQQALDIDKRKQVSALIENSNFQATDIRDFAEDLTQYERKITGTNNTEIRTLDSRLNIELDTIKGENILIDLWNIGENLTDFITRYDTTIITLETFTVDDMSMDTTFMTRDSIVIDSTKFPISPQLNENDLIMANGDRIYLLEVKEIYESEAFIVFDVTY